MNDERMREAQAGGVPGSAGEAAGMGGDAREKLQAAKDLVNKTLAGQGNAEKFLDLGKQQSGE